MKFVISGTYALAFAALCTACNKSTTPAPIHDTTVVTKIDTLVVPPPPDPTVNLKQGLLLYLPFNGSFADSSGNNNPTIATGSTPLTYDAHGYANSAFNGDGTNTIMVTNNGSIDYDTAFSVSYDFMITAEARQMLISMVDPSNGYAVSWFSSLAIPGEPNMQFYVVDQSAACSLTTIPDSASIIDSTSFIPQLNTWYNVISVYHRGTAYVYINGQLVSTKASVGTEGRICPSDQLIIGGWWYRDLIPMHGKMDEIRLYNRVLTTHEIATLSRNFQITSVKAQSKRLTGQPAGM